MNQYIKEIQNITIKYNTTVQDYLYQSNDNAITGVVIKTGNAEHETLKADLVVDASGASKKDFSAIRAKSTCL